MKRGGIFNSPGRIVHRWNNGLFFSGKQRCHVETEVTFEDGRKGSISGDLEIRDVKTTPVEYEKAS